MANVKLSPPWIIFVTELEQLFKYDSQVHVVYDSEAQVVDIYVENPEKAWALSQLLPVEKQFGNVELNINVIPSNGLLTAPEEANVYEVAFEGNPIFSFCRVISGIFARDLVYVVFVNRVVQYFNDDLSDIYGQCSTLYQTIAKDILKPQEGVFYCTDVEQPVYEDLFSPLGEWP